MPISQQQQLDKAKGIYRAIYGICIETLRSYLKITAINMRSEFG